jgi:long-chain acyl-CoA synthetase
VTRPWLKSYPPSIPADIDTTTLPSLVGLFDEAFARHASRTAIVSGGRSTTFTELDQASRRFAAWLQGEGVRPGDRVALMLPNVLPFVVSAIGALRAGATVVAVNPLYTARELVHQIRDSGAQVLVAYDAFAATVAAALPELDLKRIVRVAVPAAAAGAGAPLAALPGQIGFDEVLQAGAAAELAPVALRPDDLALLQYTGGTTGISKGAMLTHANIVSNILQIEAWFGPVLPREDAPGRNIGCFLPLYHIFALTVCLFHGLRNGYTNCLVANPRDLAGAAQEIGGRPIHLLPGVNTLFAGLAQNPALLAAFDLSQLKLAIGGGSAVQQGTADRWLAATGVPICEGYGLSETSSAASCNLVTSRRWTGTVGLPLPGTEIVIRDDAGAPVATGERGEIWLRGPQVTRGYWQRPEETARAVTDDGWFKTGDVGTMDGDGFVRIVDRKKDMILVSGFNVFPNEVEDVVSLLDGVLECAAVGAPDDRTGEAVRLFVVRANPELTAERVLAHCRQNLAPYKCPKQVEFIAALPKSTVGKVLRRELRR